MALCLLLRLFVFRLLRLKRFSTLTLKVDRKSGSAGMPRPNSYAVCRYLLSFPTRRSSDLLWASGYDVDGTDQTSLGQFSGRVQQTYKHSVPRFFVPEHGTMFTLALVRFPPTATKEIQYLNAKG